MSNKWKRKNPYRRGSGFYLAWEEGYIAALDDVKEIMEGNEYGGEHEAERTAGVVETERGSAEGQQ
jgi:hypothetical protein